MGERLRGGGFKSGSRKGASRWRMWYTGFLLAELRDRAPIISSAQKRQAGRRPANGREVLVRGTFGWRQGRGVRVVVESGLPAVRRPTALSLQSRAVPGARARARTQVARWRAPPRPCPTNLPLLPAPPAPTTSTCTSRPVDCMPALISSRAAFISRSPTWRIVFGAGARGHDLTVDSIRLLIRLTRRGSQRSLAIFFLLVSATSGIGPS